MTYDCNLNDSHDHYHEDGNLVPNPRCGFCCKASFQLLDLKRTLYVHISNPTFALNMSFVLLFLWRLIWKISLSIFSFLTIVFGKIKSFRLFNISYIPKHGFLLKINENFDGSLAEIDEHSLLLRYVNCYFLNLFRGPEIMKI